MRKPQKTNRDRPPFAKKSFGQNFLVDSSCVEKIIAELNLQKDETAVEIGAGRGALTRELVEKAGRVFAVELDPDLIPILQAEFAASRNFSLIEGDALKIDFAEVLNHRESLKKAKLVANLPYYISTAILQRLIEQRECFSALVLMLQREVAERITAPPGNSERGFLTVLIEAYAETERLFDVPPEAFRPVPKVWSSVVKIKFKGKNSIAASPKAEEIFRRIVSAGFAQKRKTIFNNLKNAQPNLRRLFENKGGIAKVLEQAEINTLSRAEGLTLNQWMDLASIIR